MFRLTGILALLLSLPFGSARAQDELPTQSEAPYEFVSGIVTELPPGKIVVNRAVLGKTPENRTFAINADTKVEGKLKVKVRVTVGYKPSEEGEPVALRIIVRPSNPKKL